MTDILFVTFLQAGMEYPWICRETFAPISLGSQKLVTNGAGWWQVAFFFGQELRNLPPVKKINRLE